MAQLGLSEEHVSAANVFFRDPGNAHTYYLAADGNRDSGSNQVVTLIKQYSLTGGTPILVFTSFYIDQLLDDFLEEGKGFILEVWGRVAAISGEDNSEWVMDRELQWDKVRTDDGVGYHISHIGNDRVYLWESQAPMGIHYIYVIPKGIGWMQFVSTSLLIFVVFTTLCMALVFWDTRRLLIPFHNVIRLFQGYNESEIKDELRFIEHTATILYEKNEQLSQLVENKNIQLKNKFLMDSVYGLLSEAEMKQGVEEYQMEFFNYGLTVLILEFYDFEQMQRELSNALIFTLKEDVFSLILKKCSILENVRCSNSIMSAMSLCCRK